MKYSVTRALGFLCCALLIGCGEKAAEPGGASQTGSGGQNSGGGSGGASGATGSGGAAGAVGTGGSGTGGIEGTGSGGTAGAFDAGSGGLPAQDAGSSGDGASSLPKAVLLLTRSGGGYRHVSIEPAAEGIRAALMPLDVTAEITAELTPFTPTGLARFGAVVLISSGAALGPITSPEVAALLAFVRGGGGVVSIHAATAASYTGDSPYLQMLGGKFVAHPGEIRTANCYTQGDHSTVTALPATFSIRDEIYTYSNRRADSQIVVTCDEFNSTQKIPLSWYHREGEGRVFNTGLGHGSELWAADGVLLKGHVVPGILWTLGL